MKKLFVLLSIIVFICLTACNSNKQDSFEYPTVASWKKLSKPNLTINRNKILSYINKSCEKASTLNNNAIHNFYKDKGSFIWINGLTNNSRIDSLLYWLDNSSLQHALNRDIFYPADIKNKIEKLRSLNINDEDNINELLGEVEYTFSKAYLYYVGGLSYGFIDPHKVLNELEDEEGKTGQPIKTSDGKTKKKSLYTIQLKKWNEEAALQALHSARTDANAYLKEIQPQSKFYKSMQDEFIRITKLGNRNNKQIPDIGTLLLEVGDANEAIPFIAENLKNFGELDSSYHTSNNILTREILDATNRFRLKNRLATDNSIGSFTINYLNRPLSYYKKRLEINMERMRWQSELEKGNKYAAVNVAAFMLQAFDNEKDSILEMRICCGSPRNKTPLLTSKISYMELNPYWNVPQSIIRKEIIPSYRRDTSYFRRNRMKVYDLQGNAVNPHSIKWSKYKGGVPFTVKQDNKQGNSLGRIIFRFPNEFAVYLHDTPSRWAFMKVNRGVSHGCVRLEKALDFAFFLLKDKDDVTMDRIRVAMDLRAETEDGIKAINKPGYKELKKYNLKESIPLFLDYYTMYYSKNGELSYCDDIYKYDKPLLEALDNIKYN